MNEIEIYKASDGNTEVEVRFNEETVWVTQAQLVKLFGSSKANISEHLKGIFRAGELEPTTTVRKIRTVRDEGNRRVTRNIEHYNLDVVISVGYRVNTKRGIHFRQWATRRLNDYLVKGYLVNQKRLDRLQQTIQLISSKSKTNDLQLNEARGLLEVINSYSRSFAFLSRFDSYNLEAGSLSENITYEIEYHEAKSAIDELKKQLVKRKEASDIFGREKHKSFHSSLQSVVQTFNGKYVYPSIEEQAHLLYFVIKNHSFNDGNKRIGAFLFIWFLEKNKHRFKRYGEVKINDNGLTALALLVAQGKPEEKDLMINLIINLIGNRD